MSLGPPFDDSGERLRMGIGAAAGAFLIFLTAFALLTADRSLGDSISIHVMVARPGALHTGAALRAAGETIGEVMAIRGQSVPTGFPGAPVDIEIRLLTAYRDRVYRNSTIVTVNPTILTEAILEVGPPAGGAAPAEPVAEGDRLRGIDPAEIDRFLHNLYVSVESVLHESRELNPEWNEFQQAISALSAELHGTLPSELLLRIGLSAAEDRVLLGRLSDKLQSAGVDMTPDKLRALARTAEPLFTEFGQFFQKLELLQDRASDLSLALAPRRRELSQAADNLRTTTELLNQSTADVNALLAGYLAGRGTLGGFNRDIQIFDELKEVHRILKRQSWRVLIKRENPGQRNVR